MGCAREACRARGAPPHVFCLNCGHAVYCSVACRDRDAKFPSTLYCNEIPVDGDYVTGGVNNTGANHVRIPSGIYALVLEELRRRQTRVGIFGGLAGAGLATLGFVAAPVILAFGAPASAITGGLAAAGGGAAAAGGGGMAAGLGVGAAAAAGGGAITVGGAAGMAANAVGLNFRKIVDEVLVKRGAVGYHDTLRLHAGTKTRIVYDGDFRFLEYHGDGRVHRLDGAIVAGRFVDGLPADQ